MVVPPPIRDPLETPTPPSLIRSPTLETPTPILADQIDAEQASSSGGADPGPGEGVPSAGSAIHETVLPSGPITVQDSPAHETAAVGARSSRVATLSDKVVRAHSAASGAPLPLARRGVEAKGGPLSSLARRRCLWRAKATLKPGFSKAWGVR